MTAATNLLNSQLLERSRLKVQQQRFKNYQRYLAAQQQRAGKPINMELTRELQASQAQGDNAPIGAVNAPGGLLMRQDGPELGDPNQRLLDGAAMLPGGPGDILGPLADIRRFQNEPESRTLGNAALFGVGLLPIVPSIMSAKRNAGNVADALRTTRRPVEYSVAKSRVGQAKKGGGFIGAPDHIKTQRQLKAWQARRMESLEKGARGRNWYKDISDDIAKMTGGDVDAGDRVAMGTAVTSNNSKVPDELAHYVRAHNQKLAGDPIMSGRFHGWDADSNYQKIKPGTYPTSMSKKLEDLHALPIEDARGGMKTDPYALNKSVAWRPELASQRPVNDMHMVNEFEYNKFRRGKEFGEPMPLSAPNPSQHKWMDEQQQLIVDKANAAKAGGFDDWDYSSEQAAQWVYQKGNGDYMAAVAGSSNGKAPHELDYYVDQAARTYREIIDQNPQALGYVTREWVPGDNTDHMKGLLSADYSTRKAYDTALEQATRGKTGGDGITQGIGGLTWDDLEFDGSFEGARNPAHATGILAGKQMGANRIGPSSEKVLDASAASHGLLGTQKQAAWNYVPTTASGNATISDYSAIRFDAGGPMDTKRLRALQMDLEKAGIDVAMVDQQGARSLVFDDQVDLKATDRLSEFAQQPKNKMRREALAPRKKIMADAKKIAEKHGVKAIPVERQSNIFPMEAPDQWSAKPFIEKIEAGGEKIVDNFNRNVAPMATDVLKAVDDFAGQHGYQQAEWFKPMMEGLAEGGLSRLKELVRSGVVPVAAFSAFLPLLEQQATSDGSPSPG